MADLYTRRTAPQPATLTYELPHKVRKRIFYALSDAAGVFGDQSGLVTILAEVQKMLLLAHGDLVRAARGARPRPPSP